MDISNFRKLFREDAHMRSSVPAKKESPKTNMKVQAQKKKTKERKKVIIRGMEVVYSTGHTEKLTDSNRKVIKMRKLGTKIN